MFWLIYLPCVALGFGLFTRMVLMYQPRHRGGRR